MSNKVVENIEMIDTVNTKNVDKSGDSGFNGSTQSMEQKGDIIIPFKPLNPLLDKVENVLQSSVMKEIPKHTLEYSSIQGSANDGRDHSRGNKFL